MTTATYRDTPPRRVLVADDDPALLHLVTGSLERAGYATVTATDGRDAFRILRSDCDFVAAIFDADIPHLTWSDLVNYMRTERRLMRIPVMLMSSGKGPLLKTHALTPGPSVILPKPFTSDQLCIMLRMVEGNRRATPKLYAA
jgi:DNA-binding response OmpR family regulator